MTVKEFSYQFDVLYNNITSNQAPGLNEYEKSIFLTKAQEEIIKNYFSPKGNPKQEGFDDSPKRQVDFSSIIEVLPLQMANSANRFDQRSLVYKMPSNLFISLNEQLTANNIPFTVIPISYQEYDRLMSKPYKFPLKYQAWRLITKNAIVSSTPSISEGLYVLNGNTYTLRTVSDYGKPIRVIVNSVVGASIPPFIEETSSSVTITMVIGKTIIRQTDGQEISIDNTNRYWQAYLVDRDGSNPTAGYLKTWNGSSGCSFPAIPIDSTWSATSLFDVLNQGGIPAGTATIAEIIGIFPETPTYKIRYIRRPSPIILAPLSNIKSGLTIQGASAAQTSELPEELHEEILQRAVELAKIAWIGNQEEIASAQLHITSGQRSE